MGAGSGKDLTQGRENAKEFGRERWADPLRGRSSKDNAETTTDGIRLRQAYGATGLYATNGTYGTPLDDLSALLETISSLRGADPRVMRNTGTWKLNNKIELNHRLSAQDVAEE